MAKFSLVKTIALDKLEGWEGCYIKLNSITIRDVEHLASYGQSGSTEKATADLKKMIKDNFVEGFGWSGKEKVAIERNDIDDLPVEVLGVIAENFFTQPSPKA